MKRLAIVSDEGGGGAAEFALVLPLLLLFLFGIIDSARLAWDYNRLAKATQMGARFAVVTDVLDSGLKDQSYVGVEVNGVTLTQGDRIPKEALGKLVCTKDGCTCEEGGTCPEAGDFDSDIFEALVARMQAIDPSITADMVRVTYSGSGLGFAGDPNGMEISPTVTVSVAGATFTPISSLNLVDLPLPDFRTSLTMEDGRGTQSN
jgi:hypothetical protein